MNTQQSRPPGKGRGLSRLVLAGAVVCVGLLSLQRLFTSPAGAVPVDHEPSVYINTYVPGESLTNTILYFGAKHSITAARASAYYEVRSHEGIAEAVQLAATHAGRPLERVTIAAHGLPGGIMLDREGRHRDDGEWLLSADLMTTWMEADVDGALSPDARVVFESCDVQPIVREAPAAESVAFRRAAAAAFGVRADNVVLFRGPAKYAWEFDGWVPRTRVLELYLDKTGAAV